MLWGFTSLFVDQVEKIQTVGLHLPQWKLSFDWLFINTELIALTSLVAFIGGMIILLLSRKMTLGKIHFGLDMIYFIAIYSFIAPLWLGKAVYIALFSVTTQWR